MHEREVLMRACRDLLAGQPTRLKDEERRAVEYVLELCIINAPPEFHLYVKRLGCIGGLHPKLDQHFRSRSRLRPELERCILEEGLGVLDDATLLELALNYVAIGALQEILTTILVDDVRVMLNDPNQYRAGAKATAAIMGFDAQQVAKTWQPRLVAEAKLSMQIRSLR